MWPSATFYDLMTSMAFCGLSLPSVTLHSLLCPPMAFCGLVRPSVTFRGLL